jgi:hypothetical protein
MRPALLLVLAGTIVASARLAPAGTEEDFRSARRTLTRQVHSRAPEECLSALEELPKYPVADAARLAVAAIERHKSPDVRAAALETLCALAQHDEPADLLHKLLLKELRARKPSQAVMHMFLALGSAGPNAAARLHDLLAEVYQPATPAAARVIALIDALGEAADSTPFDTDYAFRRAVVQALKRARGCEALDALIRLLPRLEGEARGEAVEYLAAVTGQPPTISDAQWRAWWQEHRSGFAFPAAGAMPVQPAAGPRLANSYYYNLPIYARRVVFVIDTSSSMRGERLLAAQRELINALQGLTENVAFSIVAFDSAARAWQPLLVPATAQAKADACEFVSRQQASGMTASFDALELAFSFDAEAIYFLTDGAPSAGKIPQPAKIVQVVTEQNRLRRITINAIGIGVGPEGGPFEVFLRTLAEQNYGRFRRVDE